MCFYILARHVVLLPNIRVPTLQSTTILFSKYNQSARMIGSTCPSSHINGHSQPSHMALGLSYWLKVTAFCLNLLMEFYFKNLFVLWPPFVFGQKNPLYITANVLNLKLVPSNKKLIAHFLSSHFHTHCFLPFPWTTFSAWSSCPFPCSPSFI